MKQCSKCGASKFLDEFSPDKTSSSGFTSQCKICRNSQHRKEYAQNKEKHRNRRYMYKYSLTSEEVDTMIEKREGKCDICDERNPKMVVDHCHSTGKVRGILCDDCNVGIGRLKDDPCNAFSAYVYLKEII